MKGATPPKMIEKQMLVNKKNKKQRSYKTLVFAQANGITIKIMEYDFRKIEQDWQKMWKETEAYKVSNESTKPSFYVLDMFPQIGRASCRERV